MGKNAGSTILEGTSASKIRLGFALGQARRVHRPLPLDSLACLCVVSGEDFTAGGGGRILEIVESIPSIPTAAETKLLVPQKAKKNRKRLAAKPAQQCRQPRKSSPPQRALGKTSTRFSYCLHVAKSCAGKFQRQAPCINTRMDVPVATSHALAGCSCWWEGGFKIGQKN